MMTMQEFMGTDNPPLLCLVCGKSVEKGQWFITAEKASNTVRVIGARNIDDLRPVHVACISPFPMRAS